MKKKHFLPLLMLIIGIFMAAVNVHAAEKIYNPDRACRSGDYVYYAIGNDGSGALHKYNVKTKRDSLLVKEGNYADLSVSGSYIFATRDNYRGSDGSNDYIYKIRKDGKVVKKLDKGRNPVVVGSWVYYIKTKSEKNPWGGLWDRTIGIYRMKTDGSSRQAIYKSSNAYDLMASSSKLYFWEGRLKSMSLTGKNVTNAYLSSQTTNAIRVGFNGITPVNNVVYDGWRYTLSGRNIYRTKNGVTKKVKEFPYKVQVLVEMNGWIFVVCDDGPKARVYIMRGDGRYAKCVDAFPIAGGGY